MKTTIIKTMILLAILNIRTGFSQEVNVIRTLKIEIFVEHNFEEAKGKLLKLIDSTNAEMGLLIEDQAERGTKKLTVKLLLNNRDFEALEKSLNNLGYIKSKHLISNDSAYKYSVSYLKSELNKLKLKKKKYEAEVEVLDNNNVNYYHFQHEIINLEQEIFETEQLILSISDDNLLINSIHIVMF